MTMPERVRYLRKDVLHISQAEFALSIGLRQSVLSMVERGTQPLTERNISAICARYGVHEEWLREGKGEMKDTGSPCSELEATVKAACADDLEQTLIRSYLQLSPPYRKAFLDCFREYFSRKRALHIEGGSQPSES